MTATIGLAGAAGAAWAQETPVATAPHDPPYDARDAEIAALRAELHALAEQVADLKAATSANFKAVRATEAAEPKVSVASGRPTFESADGSFKLAIRSVVQFDAAHYDISPLTTANDLGSGTVFRRARLGIDGTAFRDWNYALWGDFGGTGGESAILNQAYVEYAGWRPWGLSDPVRIRAGAWATPSGLEDATSNTEMLFLERATVAELVRGLAAGDGRTGVGAFANGERWYASAVLTGKVVGVPTTAEFNQQSGYILRAAFDPFHGPDYDTHIGATLQGILEPADTTAGPITTEAVRLQERPESRVTGTRLVDTGSITANGTTVYGLEAGASWGPLYAAGEWFSIDVDRTAVGNAASPFKPSFSGWYTQGSYALTGERHVWSSANGGFRGLKPANPFDLSGGNYGAFEIAARYSHLDLDDHAGTAGVAAPLGGIRGGTQNITSLGLNWYPNSVVRFLLDYQWVKVHRLNTAGANIGEDVNTLSFRSQFAF
jgi:phosphate-selective porin OprO/OprP